MQDEQQPEHIAVSMGWRLPDNRRVKVTYNSRVIAYEAGRDRWLVVLEDLQDPSGFASLAELPGDARAKILALSGKWAYIPDDARNDVTLPLKYETLTGQIRYFYEDDPRGNRDPSLELED
jgi:hypothetical protein